MLAPLCSERHPGRCSKKRLELIKESSGGETRATGASEGRRTCQEEIRDGLAWAEYVNLHACLFLWSMHMSLHKALVSALTHTRRVFKDK